MKGKQHVGTGTHFKIYNTDSPKPSLILKVQEFKLVSSWIKSSRAIC